MRCTRLFFLSVLICACSGGSTPVDGQDVAADVPIGNNDSGADLGVDVDTSPDATEPPEETVDLIRWSRLDAPLAGVVGALDELRDGPAAVRDGDRQTGWLAPALGGRLVADWQPWLETSVPVSSISVTLGGDTPGATVRLLDGCGGETLWEQRTEDDAVLDVPLVDAACLEAELERGRIVTLSAMTIAAVAPPDPPIGVRDPIEITHPEFGLYEGAAGPPWSWDERESMIRAHAFHGLGTYVYAPGADPFRSTRWREPYPSDEAAHFEATAALATDLEFTLTYSISPFGDWSDGDEGVLIDKLDAMATLGISSFAIAADDLSPTSVDATNGALHAAAVGAVRNWMNERGLAGTLVFLPAAMTESARATAADWPGYQEALRALPTDVRVAWSGAEAWNAETTPGELDSVAESFERDPVYLDGYWGGDQVQLGRYEGRAGVGDAAPVWIRAGSRSGVTRFNLHQFAHWTQDRPGGPTGARDFAAVVEPRWGVREGDSAQQSALVNLIARAFDGAGPDAPMFADLEDAVDAVVSDVRAGALEDRSLRDALGLFVELAALQSTVWHSALAPDLVDDLGLGLTYLRLEGERGLWAMLALREALGGRSTADADGEMSVLETSLQGVPAATSPGAIDRLRDAVDAADALPDGPDSLLFYEPPERCIAQTSLGWRPFPDADWITIAGLPGATVEDDFVQWFAPNAGTYRAVIAATAGTPTTWNFRLVDIVCGPAQQ